MWIVNKANEIIDDYSQEGYTLTLRQLYYQFVARALIENTERSYKNLGAIITNARMAGMISWYAIEDRNRSHHSYFFEEDECRLLEDISYGITFDRWDRQDHYIEVWVEKEALGNVIQKACSPLWVPHMACKGYLSASEAWRAGRRFLKAINRGQQCVLIHLGDHDPSGIDMTRDNRSRLDIFTELPGEVEVIRLALNMDQVDEYNPPPNPAKETDTRHKSYTELYGPTSWELDALEPKVLEGLIESQIHQYIDWDRWDAVEEMEEEKRTLLKLLPTHWDRVKRLLIGLNEEG